VHDPQVAVDERPEPGTRAARPVHPHPHHVTHRQSHGRVRRCGIGVVQENLAPFERTGDAPARAQPPGRGQELVEAD